VHLLARMFLNWVMMESQVKDPKGCDKCDCNEAASSCPAQAITLK
jgi:Fe-S-cluster-containing hydrogenase component 2